MKIIFLFILTLAANAASKEDFFAALAMVESGNNPQAENKKENALGVFQIRRLYFLDSKVKGKHEDVFNPKAARKVAEAYFQRYEKTAFANDDFETLARLHNGGPNWRKKMKATDSYWAKVNKNLNKK